MDLNNALQTQSNINITREVGLNSEEAGNRCSYSPFRIQKIIDILDVEHFFDDYNNIQICRFVEAEEESENQVSGC